MTTLTMPDASFIADGKQFVAEIEQFLARRATQRAMIPAATPVRRNTIGLPPVDELIAQAGIVTGPAPRQTKDRSLPGGVWKMLPDWALAARRGPRRQITVTEHLQLTALVIQRYGWCSSGLRSRSGRRCILGAQAVLYRLGYGDQDTAMAAGRVMDRILRARGLRSGWSYHEWNDMPGRTEGEVLCLLREAITAASEAGR